MKFDDIERVTRERIVEIDGELTLLQAERAKLAAMIGAEGPSKVQAAEEAFKSLDLAGWLALWQRMMPTPQQIYVQPLPPIAPYPWTPQTPGTTYPWGTTICGTTKHITIASGNPSIDGLILRTGIDSMETTTTPSYAPGSISLVYRNNLVS